MQIPVYNLNQRVLGYFTVHRLMKPPFIWLKCISTPVIFLDGYAYPDSMGKRSFQERNIFKKKLVTLDCMHFPK